MIQRDEDRPRIPWLRLGAVAAVLSWGYAVWGIGYWIGTHRCVGVMATYTDVLNECADLLAACAERGGEGWH